MRYPLTKPKMFSVHDVQRNYRAVFTQAKIEPVIIYKHNHPDVVILDAGYYKEIQEIVKNFKLKKKKQPSERFAALRTFIDGAESGGPPDLSTNDAYLYGEK